MIWPLAESVSATVPLLPQALFTARAVERILSIARALRGSMDVIGFECRLARGAERVDLGVRLVPTEQAVGGVVRGSVGGGEEPRSWIPRFTRDPVRFRRLVSSVYLEYDADTALRPPTPSIFLLLNGGQGLSRLDDVEGLLFDLMGRDRFAACKDTLAACLTTLPDGGRVLVAGAMLGRSPQSARLSLSIRSSRVGAYLRSLGWPHWSGAPSAIVRRLGSAPVVIDFDVEAGIGPKVGVHFAIAGEVAAERLLSDLVDLGLCTPGKRRALLAWPRVETVRLRKRGWPCRIELYLNHVKVACAGGNICEAKAYLGVAPALSLIR